MVHPAYEAAYNMTEGLIAMGMAVQWYWWPFLLMSLILGILKWAHRRAVRGPDVDDYRDDYIEFRGELDRIRPRWNSARRRKGW